MLLHEKSVNSFILREEIPLTFYYTYCTKMCIQFGRVYAPKVKAYTSATFTLQAGTRTTYQRGKHIFWLNYLIGYIIYPPGSLFSRLVSTSRPRLGVGGGEVYLDLIFLINFTLYLTAPAIPAFSSLHPIYQSTFFPFLLALLSPALPGCRCQSLSINLVILPGVAEPEP
jgi:hypothetical protein